MNAATELLNTGSFYELGGDARARIRDWEAGARLTAETKWEIEWVIGEELIDARAWVKDNPGCGAEEWIAALVALRHSL